MEHLQEVPCTVKLPVYLSVGSHKDTSSSGSESTSSGSSALGSGCQVIDVQLQKPQISIIRFRNNYTYAISVLYQSSAVEEESHTHANKLHTSTHGGYEVGEWKVGVANHVLMASCHCDSASAQKWVELGQSVFKSKLQNVVRLRLILRQPSPHWKQFGIENISCYYDNRSHPPTSMCSVPQDSKWTKVERLLEVGKVAHSILKSEKESNGSLSSHLRNKSLPYEVNLLATS